jgi:hypothetical protein
MVTFHSKSNRQGQYYMPIEVRKELGANLDVICNAKAAVIFNSDTPLSQVLESLKILLQDLEHRQKMQRSN